MGIIGGTDRETQFHTDIDVTFTMSGETDNGLTFGASIDLDESDDSDAFDTTSQGGETIFISGGPHTFTMGDTDGAFDANMIEVPVGGDIDSVVEHDGYSGLAGLDGFYDGQIARYDYSFDAFTVSFSVELCDDLGDVGDCDEITDEDFGDFSADPVYGIGASYEFGDFEFGVGYQWVSWSFSGGDDELDVDIYIAGLSGAYTMGDITLGANYSFGEADFDFSDSATPDDIDFDYTQFGLGAAYSMDAWTFAANWGMQEIDDGTTELDATGYGLAVHYDLGGGAVIQFGYGWSDNEGSSAVSGFNDPTAIDSLALTEPTDDDDTESSEWSFGVSMSF
jgi:outer membrane protein OmpU